MMRNILLAAGLLALSVNAFAGCQTSNMAGNWQTFIAEPELGWSSCKILFGTTGIAKSGSCRDNASSNARVTGGQLKLTTGCQVTGSIYIAGTRNKLEAGRLSADRNIVTGIVTIEGSSTLFTAVRY